ncbi:MAG: type VI secretion system-associated protein TagF [Thiocapsa sp.]|uniref:type VI secretion system-associated protein TagF n=1 Tax=Thiocapsa sp. TaxID=2024551 RepID=UPI001BCEFC42|nr:type VI secretion system-associated protein TagF [Thiocapsa sp.]QVL49166.1 MAG: type VI secretion system-associated protein TagF [Thiocapsa sp.]
MSDRDSGAPGFYGKLPSLGDFVSRRLPAELVQPWDLWLRECLAASRAELGDAWLETYLTSPLWRFVLTPGVAGRTGWAGVLMPSVDRVGRYFPLTLACPLETGVDPLRILATPDWFERAEAVTLAGLEEGRSVEEFDALTLDLGVPIDLLPGLAAAVVTGQIGSNAWRIGAASPSEVGAACSTLLARALDQVFCAYSLWWSSGSELVAPSFLVCQGLPPTDGFSALLAGGWAGRGWRELDQADPAIPGEESR